MRFPFCFYKGKPSDHVVKFVAGAKRGEGRGRIFLVGPRTTIARVSGTDVPVPFEFTELTRDGQQVMVQGEMQVRLLPATILERRDFTVDPWTDAYLTDDPEAVQAECANTLQMFVRSEVQARTLKDALGASAVIEAALRSKVVADEEPFKPLGVRVVTVFVTAVAPANPDLKKALESEAREQMLAAADKAVADRRRAAAESDRSLRAYEAETARTLESSRKELVEAQNANLLLQAEAEAKAAEKRLEPVKNLDPSLVLALGIRDMATSGRVGQFNFTPDFLAAVAHAADGKPRSA